MALLVQWGCGRRWTGEELGSGCGWDSEGLGCSLQGTQKPPDVFTKQRCERRPREGGPSRNPERAPTRTQGDTTGVRRAGAQVSNHHGAGALAIQWAPAPQQVRGPGRRQASPPGCLGGGWGGTWTSGAGHSGCLGRTLAATRRERHYPDKRCGWTTVRRLNRSTGARGTPVTAQTLCQSSAANVQAWPLGSTWPGRPLPPSS